LINIISNSTNYNLKSDGKKQEKLMALKEKIRHKLVKMHINKQIQRRSHNKPQESLKLAFQQPNIQEFDLEEFAQT